MGKIPEISGSLDQRWIAWARQTSRTGRPPGPEPKTKHTHKKTTASRAPSRGASATATAAGELRAVLRTFRTEWHLSLKVDGGWDSGLACIEATGSLSPATVRAELQRAGVAEGRFRGALFNILRSQLAGRVKQTVSQAETRLGELQRDPSPLLDRLQRLGTAHREQLLRGLGLEADQARAIAGDPAAGRPALTRALGRVRQQLAAVRKEADLGALFDRHTASMFRLFAPVARGMGLSRGSYLDGVQQAGLERCKDAETFDNRMKLVVGIAAAVVGGFLATGLLVGAATGATSAAVTGAPDLLAARHDRAAARGADRLRLARQGAVTEAESRYRRAQISYGKGLVLGTAGGAVNGKLSAAKLPHWAHGSSLSADLTNRITDP